MTIYLYARVSTSKQAAQGDSLNEQIDRLNDSAGMFYPEHSAFQFVDTGVSGGIPLDGRPKGAEMLNVVKSGDIILTTRLDRLFRNTLDGLLVGQELAEIDVTIHPLDMGPIKLDSAMGTLQYTNALAMAQYELDRSKERTNTVKRHLRESGAYQGGSIPFGKDVVESSSGKRMLVDSEEDQEKLEIIKGYLAKGLSCRAIETKLAEEHRYYISYKTINRVSQQIKNTSLG
ncbi:recombinase family protein [Vibrio parahaemolyticus]|nr:recombinase family protein [Vibrio parahaemolyticus]